VEHEKVAQDLPPRFFLVYIFALEILPLNIKKTFAYVRSQGGQGGGGTSHTYLAS
jgi:hypothetical protein